MHSVSNKYNGRGVCPHRKDARGGSEELPLKDRVVVTGTGPAGRGRGRAYALTLARHGAPGGPRTADPKRPSRPSSTRSSASAGPRSSARATWKRLRSPTRSSSESGVGGRLHFVVNNAGGDAVHPDCRRPAPRLDPQRPQPDRQHGRTTSLQSMEYTVLERPRCQGSRMAGQRRVHVDRAGAFSRRYAHGPRFTPMSSTTGSCPKSTC